jgi:hypothetical protein
MAEMTFETRQEVVLRVRRRDIAGHASLAGDGNLRETYSAFMALASLLETHAERHYAREAFVSKVGKIPYDVRHARWIVVRLA